MAASLVHFTCQYYCIDFVPGTLHFRRSTTVLRSSRLRALFDLRIGLAGMIDSARLVSGCIGTRQGVEPRDRDRGHH